MSALLLDDLRRRGFTARLHEGKLLVSPTDKLTGHDREWITRHKAALIEALELEAEWQELPLCHRWRER